MKKPYTLHIKTFLLIAGYLLSTASHSQVGSLDNTFSGDGKVTTAFGPGNDYGYSVALQSDGKIVVAGSSDNGSITEFSLVRYNSNGTPDNTFDGDSKVTTTIGSFSNVARSVAIQSDNKILAGGYSNDGIGEDFTIVRYNTNGSLDTAFGLNGKVVTEIGSSADLGFSIALQPDGKIVMAGDSYNGSNTDIVVVRYNTDGSPDSTFNGTGKVVTAISSTNDRGFSVAIQSDGKIAVGGYSTVGSSADFALVRYNSDGSLDTTFGNNGKVTTAIGTTTDIALAIAIQSNGKILLAGYSYNGGGIPDFAVVRYNSDGSLDTTFGTSGKVTTAVSSYSDSGHSIIIQSNGKIVVAGASFDGSNYNFAIVRYNSDGSPDNTFDSDGKVTTAISYDDYASSAAIQSDGKIVASGYSPNGSNHDFAVVRYIGCLKTFSSTTAYACDSYIWNGNIYTASGTYKDTIPNAAGCDSILTLNLTINTTDTSVIQSSATLTANASTATYQWIDCDNSNILISGANAQSYSATETGNYAVIITENGCTDTSGCHNVIVTSVYHWDRLNKPYVYPNPTKGTLTINTNKENSIERIMFYSIDGKRVFEIAESSNNNSISIDIQNLSQGIYFLECISKKGSEKVKVMKY